MLIDAGQATRGKWTVLGQANPQASPRRSPLCWRPCRLRPSVGCVYVVRPN